ncbi:general substrate transporter [Aspergillus keveii]|uniref:General substrate transporter n=1 Tax=Aspergillus keveii TaxID=714993 RepID=A0ABR4FL03_9EURO
MDESKVSDARTEALELDLTSVLPHSDRPWFRQPHLLKLNLLLAVPLLSGAALGFDASMMNGLQALDNWVTYFDHPSSSLLGLLNAISTIGATISCFYVSTLSDRFGRKPALFLGVVIMIGASIMQAACHNLTTFIVSRFFVGLGMSSAFIPAPVLITETAYPTHRGKMANLTFTIFYLGSIAASWTTFATYRALPDSTWSWRIPSLLQGFFPVIQLCGIYFVPESPRWLLAKGRAAEARVLLVRYHAGGDTTSLLVDHEMSEMATHIEQEQRHTALGVSSLWKTKADRRIFIIITFIGVFCNWAGNALVSYYLSLVLDSVGIKSSGTKTLINGILQVFNGLCSTLGALTSDKVGRRTLWIVGCCGMLATYIPWTVCSALNLKSGNKEAGYGVVALIFVFYFFYDISVSPMTFGYPAEILPYHNRQKGISWVVLLSNLSLMFNLFVNPIALEDIQWRYYIVYCVILACSVVFVYFRLPETANLSLEHISALFEGDFRPWRKMTRFNYPWQTKEKE